MSALGGSTGAPRRVRGITADVYDYATASDWNTSHALAPSDIANLNKASAELVGTIEREVYQNDFVDGASPSTTARSTAGSRDTWASPISFSRGHM
jgi:hypothetical protein